MEIKENTNYEGQNILIKIKGKKDPKVLVRTSTKSAFYQDGDKVRYTAFKNMAVYNGESDEPVSTKSRYGKTYIEQLPIFGGHMPSPPDDCKRPQTITFDGRTGLNWIDLGVCTLACKKKCKRWEEYRKERK
jgi:hypothetical protein